MNFLCHRKPGARSNRNLARAEVMIRSVPRITSSALADYSKVTKALIDMGNRLDSSPYWSLQCWPLLIGFGK
jgi:hypothetical protein